MSVLVKDHINQDVVKYLKVNELKESVASESLWLQLFNLIDLEEFVVKSIQDRGIVVIDEIDKICTSTINLGVTFLIFQFYR
jgi:ATP-dependent protease HslVU (ClpYQ) ATPase subunit